MKMRFVRLMSLVLVAFGFGTVDAAKRHFRLYCKKFAGPLSECVPVREIERQDVMEAAEGPFSFAGLASEELFLREIRDLLTLDRAGRFDLTEAFLRLCDSKMLARRWQRKAAMLLDILALRASEAPSGSLRLGPLAVSFAPGQSGKHGLLPLASVKLCQYEGLSDERQQQLVEVICSYLRFMHSIGRFSPAGCMLVAPCAPEDEWVWYLQDQEVLKVVVDA